MALPEFKLQEPLMANRWIIETYPTTIEPFLFRKYKMYNESDEIIFETQFMETVEKSYNPQDLLNITTVTLKYLSPVGDTVGGFTMKINGLNFEKKHSYSDDDLLITKLRFVVRGIYPIFKSETEPKTHDNGNHKE